MKKLLLFLFLVAAVNSLSIFAQPNSPLLENPPKQADVVILPVTFNWSDVAGAHCYFLEVYEDTLGINPVKDSCTIFTSSFTMPVNSLQPNTTYYWRVKTHSSSTGWGAASPFSSFTTAATTALGSAENLTDGVIDLIAIDAISQNQGNILVNRLNQACTRINNEQYGLAILNMVIFKTRIFVLRISGQISPATYNSLNYSSDGVIDLISLNMGPSGIGKTDIIMPESYSLMQNYPNPFNPSTTIEYSIPGNSFVSLKIYDMLGKEVETLVDKHQERGSYIVNWNASGLSSGIYFYRIKAGNFTETKKMILAK